MTQNQRNKLWTAINLCEGITLRTGDKEGDRELDEAEIMELLSALEVLGASWERGCEMKTAA